MSSRPARAALPRPALVVTVAAFAIGVIGAALLSLLESSSRAATAGPSSHDCGGHERWRVKTLTDPGVGRIKLTPRRVTVDRLRAEVVPVKITPSTPRQDGVETTTYKIRVTLVEARLVPDKDIHLVVRDEHLRHTMIVEFPDVSCQPAARSSKKKAMQEARAALLAACDHIPTSFVHLKGTATMTGVGFFDKIHGQKGRAPNGIELHPILSFTRASCGREQ